MYKNHIHECNQRIQNRRASRIIPYFKKLGAGIVLIIIQTAEYRSDRAHHEQNREVNDDVEVRLYLDLGSFGGCITSVQHDLGVGSSKDDEANDPRGISYSTASKEEFVDRDGFLLVFASSSVLVPQDTKIQIEVLVCRFGVEDE
jgi:hypothetical protein